jgi:hypothetical protein
LAELFTLRGFIFNDKLSVDQVKKMMQMTPSKYGVDLVKTMHEKDTK